jgi:hypothetical protein
MTMAAKKAVKTALSPAEEELKKLNDFSKNSDKAWAKKGVAIIRAMPLIATSEISLAPDLAICGQNRNYAGVGAIICINDTKGTPYVHVFPPHRRSYYLENGIAISHERFSISLSCVRKRVNYYPIDLVTVDVNAYAIEVGMRANASSVGIVKDPKKAIEMAKLDLVSIGIAESIGLSAKDAVDYARKAFSAKASGAIEDCESYTMDFSEPE